jgi:hypothetical protein
MARREASVPSIDVPPADLGRILFGMQLASQNFTPGRKDRKGRQGKSAREERLI